VRLKPGYAEAHNSLGIALAALGDPGAAAASYRRAVEIRPDYAEAQSNLGNVLKDQGKLEEAVASYRRALELKPNFADAHSNLGVALIKQGRLEEALASLEQALRVNPDHPLAHLNRGVVWLLQGDYERGLPEHEWRCKQRGIRPRPFPQPLWDGSPLEGRTILLHAEQGLGDTIQFIRYAALVKRRGGTVVAACQGALLPVLAGCPGIDALVGQDGPMPPFDVQAPLLSLPRILGTTPRTIPAEVPYLRARADLVERWQEELRSPGSFLVGITWQGNPDHREDHLRSFSLSRFEPLARIPGVRLISLQKGPAAGQVAELAGRLEVADLGDRLGDFADTAAVMRNLDLVITADSSPAHLAGALGVPVWVALPFAPDWRWMLGREDSPWYPSMRLFRQAAPGDWDGVFARMAEALERRLAAAPRSGPIAVSIGPGELEDRIAGLRVKGERSADAGERATA
jgi:hypothetical protein